MLNQDVNENVIVECCSEHPRRGSPTGDHREEVEEAEKSKHHHDWWSKVVDREEAKRQLLFCVPMILTNAAYYVIPLAAVMFSGHLGDLELAAANLANSWATVTGFSLLVGLSGALETLCGQGFGAKLYRMMGIHLQASCITSFLFSTIVSILWFYSEPILVLLRQDPQISEQASVFLKYMIPGLFAFGFLHNIIRFLQAQSVVWPLVVLSLLPLFVHLGICYALVYSSPLGFKGAALSASISLWIAVAALILYVLRSNKFEQTWTGFSVQSFRHVLKNSKLAVPSATMVCLEYWAFEILVLLSGLMPDPKVTTSLIGMCVNTETIAFMLNSGLGAAASTRVANELGAGNPNQAKHAMSVTLKLSLLLVILVISALALGHNIWAGFFSDSPNIIKKFASMTPFLVASLLFDTVQCNLSGAARGCGWQHLAVGINLGSYYLIGIPIAAVLGLKLKLQVKGLWIGLICGICSQAGSLLLLTYCRKWEGMKLCERSDDEEDNPVSAASPGVDS